MAFLCLAVSLFGFAKCDEVNYPTHPEGNVFHFQTFSDPNWEANWHLTQMANYTGKFSVEESASPQAIAGEKLLVMKNSSSYYGVSTKFEQPLLVTDKTLIVQYEVRFQQTLECGGAYMKLFSTENFSPETLCNETKYVIMFGPDKCGSTNKVHFIFRHKNPITGVVEEKHMKDAPAIKADKVNHLYTLIVRPDNSFEILIDAESVKQGNLLTDFVPSVNPPKEIDDPTDKKPADWVDEEMIPDPSAKKPEDWNESEPEYIPDPEKLTAPKGWLLDEPKFVPDPSAVKPADWDDDIHGKWEAPTIANPKCEAAPGCGEYEPPVVKNPKYKGKWSAPMIKNPAFKGVWKARQVPNPNYFEDKHPHNFPAISGAGFELWMVNKEIGFNNIFIGNDEAALQNWNKANFIPKHKVQAAEQKKLEPSESSSTSGFMGALKNFGNTVKDSIMNLYKENAAMTVILGVFVVIIPIAVCFMSCFRRPRATEEAAPAHEEPKAEETKTEEKPKVEEVPAEEPKAEEKPKVEEVKEEPKVEEKPKVEEIKEEPKIEKPKVEEVPAEEQKSASPPARPASPSGVSRRAGKKREATNF